MKWLIGTVAVLGLVFAAPASADDEKKETKVEKKSDHKSAKVKSERKVTKDPDGMNNSTKDTASVEADTHVRSDGTVETEIERTKKHDEAGMKKDAKHKTKEKVTRDSQGNVIDYEKKTE